MSHASVDNLIQQFRRYRLRNMLIRYGAIAALIGGVVVAEWYPEILGPYTYIWVLALVIIVWFGLVLGSMYLTRLLQLAGSLLMTGQDEFAEVWLRRIVKGISLTPQVHLSALQQFAVLSARKGKHHDVVVLCREVLRHRLRRLRHITINTRLLLADTLLVLDRFDEAYDAYKPVLGQELTLAEQMKLLPIQLRYEVGADQITHTTDQLPEKIRIAELLDTRQAALVHALLAEACRRQAKDAEHRYLASRARLYGGLEELANDFTLIRPILEGDAPDENREH